MSGLSNQFDGGAAGAGGDASAANQELIIDELEEANVSLAIMDDWDETDRAKVNIVVGQAGISAGAGTIEANTPRVTIASNDPLLTSIDNIDSNTADAAGLLSDISSNIATASEQVTQTTSMQNTEASVGIMDDWDNAASDGASVSGDVPHDTADAGEPVKIGGKAVNADPTAVTANDRVNALFDLVGKQVVLPHSLPENQLSGLITTSMTGTTSTAVTGMGAQGGSLRKYITTVIISNAHGTVGTDVILQDGNGGSTLGTFPAAALYGGVAINLPIPIKTTANTALYAANVTTGASTKVTCYGYKGV
jgi:hypothetical protein